MIHHLVNEEEVFEKCLYCGKKFDKEWKSNFDVLKHYKQVVCSCGKINKIRVKFHGSGHDDWTKSRLREAQYMENRK